jgi:hypothetical protein
VTLPRGAKAVAFSARPRPKFKRTQIACAAVAACGLLASSPVSAQIEGLPTIPGFAPPGAAPLSPAETFDKTGPVAVQERTRPDLEPQGLRLGTFRILPSLKETTSYDSNLFAEQSNTSQGVVIRSRPEVKIDNGPGPSVRTLNFNLYVEDARYIGHSGLSNDNVVTSLALGSEFGPDTRARSLTGFSYTHQDPSSFALNIPNTKVKRLPLLTTFSQDIGLSHDYGDVGAIAVDGGYLRQDYENIQLTNGAPINQTILNSNAYHVGPKLSYNLTPVLRPYFKPTYTRTDYDSDAFNNNEYALVAGTDFEFRRLFRGTAFLGYKDREYDKSSNPAARGFTYGMNLSWFPTELLTVSAQGGQNFSDSLATSDTGVHSVVDAKTVSVSADYEVLRNVIASALAAFEDDSYLSTPREDKVYSAGAGIRYVITPQWEASAQYQYSKRNTNAAGFGYDRNLISAAVKLSF